MKIGLKVFPRDFMLANRLQKDVDYFELFAARGEERNIKLFQGLDAPIHVIHAEHSGYGVNVSDGNRYGMIMESMHFAQETADMFGSRFIIVHPGARENESCSVENGIGILRGLGDKRVITENLPFRMDLAGRKVDAFGRTPPDIRRITESAGVGFCFDLGHAWSVAYVAGADPVETVKEFLALRPAMFHFYDSIMQSETETHLNMGDGNADLGLFRSMLPADGIITLETKPDYEKRRRDLKIMRKGL